MNQIQRNALAYRNLLTTEYYFCLAVNNKGYEVRLRFSKEDFHHLEGFGQLKDLAIHAIDGQRTYEMALLGKITEDNLKCSDYYELNSIQNKIDYLYLLETALDHNDMVFKYIKDKSGKIRIEAKFLLFTDLNGDKIYVYIDKAEDRSDFFCRSFIANPAFDRTNNQKRMTVLWKEKRNLITGKHLLQYRFKEFSPEQLNKE